MDSCYDRIMKNNYRMLQVIVGLATIAGAVLSMTMPARMTFLAVGTSTPTEAVELKFGLSKVSILGSIINDENNEYEDKDIKYSDFYKGENIEEIGKVLPGTNSDGERWNGADACHKHAQKDKELNDKLFVNAMRTNFAAQILLLVVGIVLFYDAIYPYVNSDSKTEPWHGGKLAPIIFALLALATLAMEIWALVERERTGKCVYASYTQDSDWAEVAKDQVDAVNDGKYFDEKATTPKEGYFEEDRMMMTFRWPIYGIVTSFLIVFWQGIRAAELIDIYEDQTTL